MPSRRSGPAYLFGAPAFTRVQNWKHYVTKTSLSCHLHGILVQERARSWSLRASFLLRLIAPSRSRLHNAIRIECRSFQSNAVKPSKNVNLFCIVSDLTDGPRNRMSRSVGACFCCVPGWAGVLISDHVKGAVFQ